MIAYSLFMNLYIGVLSYVYSKDRREWWDLSQGEKDELILKHLPEPEELEGTFPVGWFNLEDWEKKAILDKNLDDYYKDVQVQSIKNIQDFIVEQNRTTKYRRCTIV